MPLPLIIAAGVAGVLGIGGHISAKDANEEAERVSRKAQRIYNDAKESLENAKNNAQESLVALGYAKSNVMEHSVKQFIPVAERIKDVELKNSLGMEELSDFMIDEQGVIKLKEMSDIYSSVISSSAAGAATGALIGLAASGSLSIVTGGISLAGVFLATGDIVGAATVAGSSLSLGLSFTPLAAIAAPVVLFTGISASVKADENLEKAKAMLAEAEAAVAKMNVSITMCDAITKRSDMFRELLEELNRIFSHYTENLDKMTERKLQELDGRRIRSTDLTKEEKKLAYVTFALAGAVKAVIDVPILSKEGNITDDSQTVYDKVQTNYNGMVEKGVVQKLPPKDTMFCTGCGEKIKRNVKFCQYCGKKIMVAEN